MAKYRFGFFMSQTAGNITYYQNLRRVTGTDDDIDASWAEIHYYKKGGAIEKLREQLVPITPIYLSSILRATLDMRDGFRSGPYDALFINDNAAIFFQQALRGIPTIFDRDATPIQIDRMPEYCSPKDSPLVARFKWLLWRNMINSATLVQVWSRWAGKSMIDDYQVPAERVYVNPPGIDLEQWRPAPGRSDTHPNRPLRVLFVGGDFQRKGGQLLLEWFRQRSGSPCELHIVTREPVAQGPGIYIYQNMQPNTPELLQLYHQSDVFVLPSLAECFGIATVEAMGTGLPVIASDAGATADIIEPGRNGYIVPAGDIPSLSAAIERVLGDARLRATMGHESRVLAEQRFDVQTNSRRTLNYLKQIAEARYECINASGHNPAQA